MGMGRRMCLIAARQSHLARLQALTVGRALEKKNPNLKVRYHFRESLGDKNLTDPLWKMPEKGVFTEDFVDGLRSGEFDLVVHSWKDLPMDERKGLDIVATMPRVDAHDLLLVKKSYFEKNNKEQLKVFSSSPRRILNISDFLKEVWPFALKSIEFESVRGNIPTRIRKMHEDQNIDGLIVAKAALDRLMSAEAFFADLQDPTFQEWSELRKELLELIQDCQWMVLPLSANPTAAAQGALAIEVASHRSDLKELVASIHCEETFQNVLWEREILKNYGGGCHQAIGVSVVNRDTERLAFIRGKTPTGERLLEIRRQNHFGSKLNTVSKICIPQSDDFFTRENHPLKINELAQAEALFFARSNSLPIGYQPPTKQILWTAGVKSWKKIAKDGYWVNGCSDSLGFEAPDLAFLGKENLSWLRLTHEGALRSQGQDYGSYKLVAKEVYPNIPVDADLYYWKSGSLFERALELYPFLKDKNHACGLGETSKILKKYFELDKNLFLFFDETDFLSNFKTASVIPLSLDIYT
jgi:hydroxymethylbilane synthase